MVGITINTQYLLKIDPVMVDLINFAKTCLKTVKTEASQSTESLQDLFKLRNLQLSIYIFISRDDLRNY